MAQRTQYFRPNEDCFMACVAPWQFENQALGDMLQAVVLYHGKIIEMRVCIPASAAEAVSNPTRRRNETQGA